MDMQYALMRVNARSENAPQERRCRSIVSLCLYL